MFRDEEDVVLRIDHDFHVERAVVAVRARGVAAGDAAARTENRHAGRVNRLPDEGGRNRGAGDSAGQGLVGARGQSERAIIGYGTSRKTGLLPRLVEDVGRDGVVGLDEKDDPAAAGKVAFVKAASAFLCLESRREEGKDCDARCESE